MVVDSLLEDLRFRWEFPALDSLAGEIGDSRLSVMFSAMPCIAYPRIAIDRQSRRKSERLLMRPHSEHG